MQKAIISLILFRTFVVELSDKLKVIGYVKKTIRISSSRSSTNYRGCFCSSAAVG